MKMNGYLGICKGNSHYSVQWLQLALCLLLVGVSISACSSGFNNPRSAWSNQYADLDHIKGVVDIESPTVGTLLQLRGVAGKGILTVKQETPDTCVSVPVRLAAGDFGGESIGIHSSAAIRLVINSSEVANKLLSGDEVVSEDYDVTQLSDSQRGDIKIESGLDSSYGFVLNPGEWFWSSWFGLDQTEVSCGKA
jgi:hypothetical protein